MASDTVTARQAADMTGHSERTIRRMIASGRLRARRVAVNRFEIAVVDLPVKKRDPLGELRAQVEALERRVRTLEAQNSRLTRYDAILSDGSLPPMREVVSMPVSHPTAIVAPPAIRMRHTSMGDAGAFDNRAEAARWLTRHGISSEGTPKSWPGWRDVALEPRAVLQLAMSLWDPHNHRITWRLHPCADEGCVCHELLGSVEAHRG